MVLLQKHTVTSIVIPKEVNSSHGTPVMLVENSLSATEVRDVS